MVKNIGRLLHTTSISPQWQCVIWQVKRIAGGGCGIVGDTPQCSLDVCPGLADSCQFLVAVP